MFNAIKRFFGFSQSIIDVKPRILDIKALTQEFPALSEPVASSCGDAGRTINVVGGHAAVSVAISTVSSVMSLGLGLCTSRVTTVCRNPSF